MNPTKCLLAIVIVSLLSVASAQESEPQPFYNKTMGGKQYWGDVVIFHDWRIQRNVFTNHYRLLDGEAYRHASGSFDTCRAALAEIRQRQNLPPMSGKVVVLVHGLFRTAKSMKDLQADLQVAGFDAVSFDYPSTQIDIREAADFLHKAIQSLEDAEEICFVTHSLGGLVVRACLAEHPDERVKRIVFIGVPNTGAHLADIVERNWLWKAIAGPAGKQLITDRDSIIASLPQPACEFAIIAGGCGDDNGYNPLIPGDDDFTVAVASTQLPGSADFSVVRCRHTFLTENATVRRQTVSFLKHGRLRER